MTVVLVVSEEKDLACAVNSAADALPDCRPRWIRGLRELGADLLDESVGLVVVHVDSGTRIGLLDALIQQLRERVPQIPILLIRDEYDGEQNLHYMRMGVRECLTRPLDLRRLAYLLDSLTLKQRLSGPRSAGTCPAFEQAYRAASPSMRIVLEQAQRIAPRNVHVLLVGETGTGKTHLARLIHQISSQASRPYLSMSCAAVPTNLVESELFGHQKGAFTGADQERIGKFEHVEDGTLLLDDIDALALPAQAKLLRVLDEGVFEQVGSNRTVPFRARLIAASNQPLEDLIEKDLFRADLFYRLNVICLHVPPLRDRIGEIRPLSRRFLEVAAAKYGVSIPQVDPAVWEVFEQYRWPGNVRELRNGVERALTLCDGSRIQLEDLPVELRQFDQAAMPAIDAALPEVVPRQPLNTLARAA